MLITGNCFANCPLDGEFSKEKPPVVLLVEASSWEESGANWIDGSALASRGRLMVASVNFRLGILGTKNCDLNVFARFQLSNAQ